ncbi:SNW/SKI-interacting protein [Astathelohania contejeani]|uniref:Pre-mRNA-processing protein 45 n=1 Tax=Astathelohania contejeani TaxID=164912 RepID=A0ABQ7I2R8_9MICR|nr:SNW/SKI-interacting protein [Thelohania contejeani]
MDKQTDKRDTKTSQIRDPLESSIKKKKFIVKLSTNPKIPVMRSGTEPATNEAENFWKIPGCISKWTNPKGYIVPLEKRIIEPHKIKINIKKFEMFNSKFDENIKKTNQKNDEIIKKQIKTQRIKYKKKLIFNKPNFNDEEEFYPYDNMLFKNQKSYKNSLPQFKE